MSVPVLAVSVVCKHITCVSLSILYLADRVPLSLYVYFVAYLNRTFIKLSLAETKIDIIIVHTVCWSLMEIDVLAPFTIAIFQ